MSKKRIYFLYQTDETLKAVFDFLNFFYEIESELITFPILGIKTKELYFQIEQRLTKSSFDFLIIQFGERLEVFDSMKRRIAIDFDSDRLNYGRKVFSKDPFLRAIGKSRKMVLDVSAGLGIDAVFLAQNGHQVTALERNPLLFMLLDRAAGISEYLPKLKIRFQFGSAVDFLSSQNSQSKFDCIYYDPMFPDKTKTALPKQEMVLFRQLVGNDLDSESVIEILLAQSTRVVVKRPIGAPSLALKAHNCFESKLIRYDIYEGK